MVGVVPRDVRPGARRKTERCRGGSDPRTSQPRRRLPPPSSANPRRRTSARRERQRIRRKRRRHAVSVRVDPRRVTLAAAARWRARSWKPSRAEPRGGAGGRRICTSSPTIAARCDCTAHGFAVARRLKNFYTIPEERAPEPGRARYDALLLAGVRADGERNSRRGSRLPRRGARACW